MEDTTIKKSIPAKDVIRMFNCLVKIRGYMKRSLLKRNPFSAEEEVLLNLLEREIDDLIDDTEEKETRSYLI